MANTIDPKMGVRPKNEITPIKTRTTKMQNTVDALVIKDDKGLSQASDIRKGIKEVIKQIKEVMEAPIKRAYQAYKEISIDQKKIYGGFLDMCNESSKTLDSKVIVYNSEIEKIRLEKEEKLLKRVEKGTMKVETAAKKLEETPEVKRHVASERSTMTISKVKKFKVVNLLKVPIAYHLANESAIRKAMYAGEELPGVKYWLEDSVSGR